LLVHSSRTLRRGSDGVDLVVHMSAPRAPRPPLRMVIEETWQTFFTKHAGRAVQYGQQLERAAAGPIGRLVLSMSGYPCRGWRDNSNKQSIINAVTPSGVVFFRPKREGHFRIFIFSRYVLSKAHRFFGVGCSLGLSPSLRDSNVRIAFRAALPPYSKLLDESFETFLESVFCMIIRRDVFPLADTTLILESWFFIPRIMFHGPAVPSCFTDEGSQFLG
jgi:hypothetical protein